ncbi:MAG: hypothetical protein AABY10_04950, partial [Nanoarchaeota archaeon]
LNTGSNNDPIVVNNTANANITNFTVTAYDLLKSGGAATDVIYAANLSVGNNSQGCTNVPGSTVMSNSTLKQLNQTVLLRGNNTLNYANETTGQEQVFFCVNAVNSNIASGTYSNPAAFPWVLAIVEYIQPIIIMERQRI